LNKTIKSILLPYIRPMAYTYKSAGASTGGGSYLEPTPVVTINKNGATLFRTATAQEKRQYQVEQTMKNKNKPVNEPVNKKIEPTTAGPTIAGPTTAGPTTAGPAVLVEPVKNAEIAIPSLVPDAFNNDAIELTRDDIKRLEDLSRIFDGGGGEGVGVSCAERQFATILENLKKIKKEDEIHWAQQESIGKKNRHDAVKKFTYFLFNYVGEPFCFEKGAFVIKDASFNLYKFLYQQRDIVDHPVFFGSITEKTILKEEDFIMPSQFNSHTSYLNKKPLPPPVAGAPSTLKYGVIYEIHMYDKNILIRSGCNTLNTEDLFKYTTDKKKLKKSPFCNGKIHLYVNVKWYPFQNNGENYIFYKLEGYPTKTWKHLGKWFERFHIKNKTHNTKLDECTDELTGSTPDPLMGTSELTSGETAMAIQVTDLLEKKEEKDNAVIIKEEMQRRKSLAPVTNTTKQCDSRREDELPTDLRVAPKEGYKKPLGYFPYRNYDAFKLPNNNKFILTEETYTRKGDEFFIPQEVSEYFLESSKINRELMFIYPKDKKYTKEVDIEIAAKRNKYMEDPEPYEKKGELSEDDASDLKFTIKIKEAESKVESTSGGKRKLTRKKKQRKNRKSKKKRKYNRKKTQKGIKTKKRR